MIGTPGIGVLQRSSDETAGASGEAAIRRKIRRLLRQHHYQPVGATVGGGGEEPYDVNHYTQLVLEQAKALYRYWPDVEGRLFE